MISVRNRRMIVPPEERTLGIAEDNNSSVRVFTIPRYSIHDIDLSNMIFFLDFKYMDGTTNETVFEDVIVNDSHIELTWQVMDNDLKNEGTLLLQLKAVDMAGVVKWRSYIEPFYVGDCIDAAGDYTGELSAYEALVARCVIIENKEVSREAAEELRESAEEIRQINEAARQSAESIREQNVFTAISDANAAKDGVLDAISDVDEKIYEIEQRFNELTTEQQQDAEVIEARKGKGSLKLKIDDIDSKIEAIREPAVDIANPPGDLAGCVNDNETNNTDAFRAIYAEYKNLFVPEGTFVFSPTETSGYFLLYLSSVDGFTITGCGPQSVLKLGDDVGPNVLLFGAGMGNTVKNVTFRNLTIDLNGQNNLQNDFSDPLRYNSFCYFFCPCEHVTFENVIIRNVAGHQAIRIGNDSAEGYGKDIKVLNCTIENFGISIPDNNQQDVSAVYIQADDIMIKGNKVLCDNFDFNLSKGHTAFELHGSKSTIVTDNYFDTVQLPVLIVSSFKNNSNVIIDNNIFNQCNYLVSLDSAMLDQKRVTISNNVYYSTKVMSHIVSLGGPGEPEKVREDIVFDNNTLIGWGNTNQRTHVFYLEGVCIRSLYIRNNRVSGFNGSLLYMAGVVRNSEYAEIHIKNNDLDSLGATSGDYPNTPHFIHISLADGIINVLTILDNTFSDSALKSYTVGCILLMGDMRYVYCKNNKPNNVPAPYNLIYDGITSNYFKELDDISGIQYLTIGSIASMSSVITTLTINGARVGNQVIISPYFDLQGLQVSAYVSADDTIKLVLFNPTGAAIAPGNNAWRFKIIR